ncbi:hypothetical protein [Noviherbaspirillum sedimenti]|nr:hypothetical protein [Noviherbaspirillum sedimenti]
MQRRGINRRVSIVIDLAVVKTGAADSLAFAIVPSTGLQMYRL